MSNESLHAAKHGPRFVLPVTSRRFGVVPEAATPPPAEPPLEIDEIQGNVIPGFNKDHQVLVFLNLLDVPKAKAWLRATTPQIATAREVLAFNRLFRELRARRGAEPTSLRVVWMNLAFSFSGIERLTSDAAGFPEGAFRAGLPARSALLGDPTDPNSAGHPSRWLVGAEGNVPDLLMIVAGDDPGDTERKVARLLGLDPTRELPAAGAELPACGLRVAFIENGAVLPQKGHEHFGFKDGISQPGVRGTASDAPDDFLTPRTLPAGDPLAPFFGKPGQLLIWPGEFILGHRRQHDSEPLESLDPIAPQPAWTRNGSFLVFRRLRQDMAAFQRFLEVSTERLRQVQGLENLDVAAVGARFVGRWKSGAPLMRAPRMDDPLPGADDTTSNHFFFAQETAPVTLPGEPPQLIPGCPADTAGFLCPHAAHVRKVNPRDVSSDSGSSLTRRMLRRGVPYGPPFDPGEPASAEADRGLLFLAYTASIEETFELLQQTWCNDPLQPEPGGHDPIIGQNPDDPQRRRSFTLSVAPGVSVTLTVEGEWVVATGGGYFFSPALSAIVEHLAS